MSVHVVEEHLFRIALWDSNSGVRCDAAAQVKNPNLLLQLIKDSNDYDVRQMAAWNLLDIQEKMWTARQVNKQTAHQM